MRSGRVRIFGGGLCVACALLAGAAWVDSLFTVRIRVREHQRIVQAVPGVESGPFAWELWNISESVMSSGGSIAWIRGEQLSLRDDRPALAPPQPAEYGVVPQRRLRQRTWEGSVFFRGALDWKVGRLGIYRTTGGGAAARVIEAPYWLFVVAFVGAGAALVRPALRRRMRRRRGRCAACGYDLHGIAADSPCPECGTIDARRPPGGS